jgi:chromosome segregation ATPase
MPKVLSDTEYNDLIQDWQNKLDKANKKILELSQELRDNFHNKGAENVKLQMAMQEAQAIAEKSKHEIQKAREDARNAKERAKRFKKRIAKLEQELLTIKKDLDTLESQK